MEIIDWRALYAANRAVIEGHPAGRAPALRDHVAPGPLVDPGRLAPDHLTTGTSLPDHLTAGTGLLEHLPTATPLPGGLLGTGSRVMPATLRPAASPADPATAHVVEHHDGRRARRIRLHVPERVDPATPAPLVVALHGCTQTAATFAAGALLDEEADRRGVLVAYPEQIRDDNPQGCWNWFSAGHQARGAGEPAFLAGATRAVMAAGWAIDPERVYVAGMSAGAAMASVLAATYPDMFAALAMHSGLAYGCARSLPAATQAMTRGAPDPEAQGRAAFGAMGAAARPVPALVIHGTADAIVCPVNGEHAVRQWMTTNRLAASGGYEPDAARPDAAVRDDAAGRRADTRRTWFDAAGRVMQEHVEVEGLGHAWSGGAAGGSYTDPRGPSAAAAILDFFARVSA
jgi:poly(hydroxyalkanoate) depolymerase family esterase